MAFPAFSADTFRKAALGLGMIAMTVTASNTLMSSTAHAQDSRPVAATEASYSEYTELGLPAAQAPTAERPYHYMRFDEQTKAQYPNSDLPTAKVLNTDKLLIMNFIDEQNPQFSAMQTKVLTQTLSALATKSQDKELMLMDVVVRDAQGNGVYWADYATYFDDNQLGPDGQAMPTAEIPYLVVWGEPLKEGGSSRLFDAAIMNGVQNDNDLNANAENIYAGLWYHVKAYNQKKTAGITLTSATPQLASMEQ